MCTGLGDRPLLRASASMALPSSANGHVSTDRSVMPSPSSRLFLGECPRRASTGAIRNSTIDPPEQRPQLLTWPDNVSRLSRLVLKVCRPLRFVLRRLPTLVGTTWYRRHHE